VIGEIVDLIGEAKAQEGVFFCKNLLLNYFYLDNEDARKMLDLFFPVAVTMAGRQQYVAADSFNYESI
jgi:hypothetical protein